MNQASVDRRFRYAHRLLAERFPNQLTALFSPQHGLWGEQQANMIETGHSRETRLGVPIYSLYSSDRKPTAEMLNGLDCLVIDLQDVGTRVYTFIWTVAYCLQACAETGLPVLVLDRPNPLGGTKVEGPRLDPRFRSFVGLASVPMRHCLTIGEMARYLNRTMAFHADLEVIALTGWKRSMPFAATGLSWIAPSPNLPRLEGVCTYPGQVLLEGTNLSEGRGTTTPFELIGAPFINPDQLCDAAMSRGLPGVTFRPIRFLPTFDKWAGQSCGGVYLHVTSFDDFQPLKTTVALLAAVRQLYPQQLKFLPPPYEYETQKMPFDIIAGGDSLRLAIEADRPIAELLELCQVDEANWFQEVADDLLYT